MSTIWFSPGSRSVDESAYTEIVIDNHAFAIEAVVGDYHIHQNILQHFGLNERQVCAACGAG